MTVIHDLEALQNPEKARFLQGFFKTGPGQYSEGDIFMGITVPNQRIIAQKHRDLPLQDCLEMLQDPRHEVRLTSLIIMVNQFNKGTSPKSKTIFDAYIRHRGRINNWDLVDLSAPKIVGNWLFEKDRQLLHELAGSDVMWDRRIAVVSTLTFIKKGDFADTLCLCSGMLDDRQDLMHKACGWMLREVGKKDADVLRGFLLDFAHRMPRTMLRYAIEKFDEPERKQWLAIKKV